MRKETTRSGALEMFEKEVSTVYADTGATVAAIGTVGSFRRRQKRKPCKIPNEIGTDLECPRSLMELECEVEDVQRPALLAHCPNRILAVAPVGTNRCVTIL